MKNYLLALIPLLLCPMPAKANIDESIEKTTQYLMKNWRSDETLQKLFPPQVLSVPKGTTVYGGCGEHMMGDDVGGSYYCPYTHTVILDKSQLKAFHEAFGASSVAYVIAHEFSHALQGQFKIKLEDPNHELQADCMAGVFIAVGSEELDVTREDTISMAQAAYNIGDKTHGTGAQRAFALMGGMGRVDFDCKPSSIEKLANNEITHPLYKTLTRTRSGAGGIDLAPTPYRKTAKGALGLKSGFFSF